MERLPEKIRNELREFRETQEELLLHYRSEKNNEMAYLVHWSLLEKMVKAIVVEYRRTTLINSLQDWLSHIKADAPKPSKKPNTAIELNTLPQKNEFIASLNHFGVNGPKVWSVMASSGKHRRHRNELAHTGKKFVNYVLYQVLCSVLERTAQEVFEQVVSNKSLKT